MLRELGAGPGHMELAEDPQAASLHQLPRSPPSSFWAVVKGGVGGGFWKWIWVCMLVHGGHSRGTGTRQTHIHNLGFSNMTGATFERAGSPCGQRA